MTRETSRTSRTSRGIRPDVREAVECDGDEAMDRERVYRVQWNP